MGNGNGLPTWAKVLLQAPLVAITAYLLAQSAGWIPSEAQLISKAIAHNSEVMKLHVKNSDDLAASIRIAARIMCENAAQSERAYNRCQNIQP